MAESIPVGATHRDTDTGSSHASVEGRQYTSATTVAAAHDDGQDAARRETILTPPDGGASAHDGALEAAEGEESRAPLQAVALPAERVRALAARKTAPPRFAPEFDAGPVVVWVLLAVPTLAVVATAIGAILAAFGSLLSLVHSMLALQFSEAANALPSLDTSGRILLAAAGYFALLVALRALSRGIRASGWKRLRALWAMVVTLPAAWLFVAGAGLASEAGPFSSIPADVWRGVVLFLLLQMIALAVVTTQSSARALVGGTVLRSGYIARISHGWSQPTADMTEASAPLPVVRFGPPQDGQLADDEDRDEDRPEFRISGLFVVPREASLVEDTPQPTRPSEE